MLKKLLMGAAALTILGGVALADNTATTTAPQPQAQDNAQADNGDNPPPPPGDDQGGDGWWGHHRHHHHHGWGRGDGDNRGGWEGRGPGGPDGGRGGPGMMGMRGPGGPGAMMMNHEGFRLQLGKGISVGVMCGKEAIKDCIADAQPLIDAAKAAATQAPAK